MQRVLEGRAELGPVVHDVVDEVVHLAAGTRGAVVLVRALARQDVRGLVGAGEGCVVSRLGDLATAETESNIEGIYAQTISSVRSHSSEYRFRKEYLRR